MIQERAGRAAATMASAVASLPLALMNHSPPRMPKSPTSGAGKLMPAAVNPFFSAASAA